MLRVGKNNDGGPWIDVTRTRMGVVRALFFRQKYPRVFSSTTKKWAWKARPPRKKRQPH